MDAIKVSEPTGRQLEALTPEKRARAEAAVARTQTPEARALEAGQREALDREYPETGQIGTVGGMLSADDLDAVRRFLATLRGAREARGLSLADVAARSGIDKAALSRLENGRQVNPTLGTLARYARAVGRCLTLSLDEPDRTGPGPAAGEDRP